MRRALLVGLPAIAGCYPWIPGGWDAYWLPEQVQIVGQSTNTEWVGGYWVDDSPEGETWWGWLAEPQDDLLAVDLLAPDGTGCWAGQPDEQPVADLLGDPGAYLSELAGPTRIQLAWVAGDRRFRAITDQLPGETWSLEPVETSAAGTLRAEDFLTMPGEVAIQGPKLDGETPVTVTLAELRFTWEPESEAADYAVVEVWLARGSASGYQPFEWATCVLPWEDGEATVNPALWAEGNRAEAAYVFLGLARETFVRAGNRGFSASALGLRRQVGVVFVEPIRSEPESP